MDRRLYGGLSRALIAPVVAAVAMLGWSGPAHAQACAEALAGTGWRPPSAVSSAGALDFEDLVAGLSKKRVVMIGEVHDRYEHHLNQLALICRLHRQHPDLAIGLEFFQQPFQQPLDAYVERRIDTREMLAKTEYFSRWQFDYRLYAPILEFARQHGIPLVALNASQEISSKVAREGISALSEAERAQLPAQLDHNNLPGYRKRLRAVFEQHPEIQHMSFDNFVEAQLVWDETMAKQAARYLEAHPDKFLVVLAGDGHVVRSGIPARFARLSGVEPLTVLQGQSKEIAPEDGDYLLLSEAVELPPSGKLGVMLDTRDDRVVVSDFSEDSAAKDAGILKQDQIVKLDGEFIASFADLKLILMDKRPGDPVSVTVERAGSGQMTREASFSVTLR
ncbi:MAG: ChaN family lipoprotein [Gammaproteobacteria bacterium]|nr:ChaN family lipoprotein [Gammaproteobacteria bacterium]